MIAGSTTVFTLKDESAALESLPNARSSKLTLNFIEISDRLGQMKNLRPIVPRHKCENWLLETFPPWQTASDSNADKMIPLVHIPNNAPPSVTENSNDINDWLNDLI